MTVLGGLLEEPLQPTKTFATFQCSLQLSKILSAIAYDRVRSTLTVGPSRIVYGPYSFHRLGPTLLIDRIGPSIASFDHLGQSTIFSRPRGNRTSQHSTVKSRMKQIMH